MKQFKYVVYRLSPIMGMVEAESKKELIQLIKNTKKTPGGFFIELSGNKVENNRFGIPIEVTKKIREVVEIAWIKELEKEKE